MTLAKGLIYLLLLLFIFQMHPCNAQELKYSLGPHCKEKKVICKNPDEVPVCLTLDPRVHIEKFSGKEINRYQPSCVGHKNDIQPVCVDLDSNGYKIADGVVIECIENIKCKNDINKNKLTAYCQSGKTPKCLGSDSTPNCDAKSICEGNSVPICDYVWQANSLLNNGTN